MKEAILTVLMALAPHHTDKALSDAERRAMLEPVAEAISDASRQEIDTAGALIALGQHETHYARYILENRCKDGPKGSQCDLDKDGNPRAAGPWQLWATACEDRTTLASQAQCAARRLRGERERCKGRHPAGLWAGAFAGYRSIVCDWAPAADRARTMQGVVAKLRRAM